MSAMDAVLLLMRYCRPIGRLHKLWLVRRQWDKARDPLYLRLQSTRAHYTTWRRSLAVAAERLKERREQLVETLRQTAIQLEQVRGALALCDELIAEAEGNGRVIPAE